MYHAQSEGFHFGFPGVIVLPGKSVRGITPEELRFQDFTDYSLQRAVSREERALESIVTDNDSTNTD